MAHATALITAVHGLDHLAVAGSHFALAVVHFQKGNYEKALANYQKQHDILIRVRGRDHPGPKQDHTESLDNRLVSPFLCTSARISSFVQPTTGRVQHA